MKDLITVVIAARNDQDIVEEALKSVYWANEIIVVISFNSYDLTEEISRRFTNKVFRAANHLGYQRNFGITKSTGNWILVLDTDERVTKALVKEIQERIKNQYKICGFLIPYKNHFLGKSVNYGNQKYEKLRLFNKNKGTLENLKTHPEVLVTGQVDKLNNFIYHYSFRSITQVLRKFTYYAQVEAPLLNKKGERATIKKLTMYPAHMFWSIFIEDQGYKDGIWGFGLAACFAYYELARYYYLLKVQLMNRTHFE